MPLDDTSYLTHADKPPTFPNAPGIDAAINNFGSKHPYLLFNEEARRELGNRARASSKLEARLRQCLGDGAGPATARERIKRRARSLIIVAFVAAVCGDSLCDGTLRTMRALLDDLVTLPRWNVRPITKSFLDSAEIAVAIALAYDWLYDDLTNDERRAIECALLTRIVRPAHAAYTDGAVEWPHQWNNFTFVSNTAVLIAALAMLSRYPDPCREVIHRCLGSSWRAFEAFAPDGAWLEGPSYWSLDARYTSLMVAALESALGSDFGFAARPGFAQTGDFALHAMGASGAAFDFADSDRTFDPAPLAWFARRFNRPIDGWLVADYNGWHLPFTLIWAVRPAVEPSVVGVPTAKVFRGAEIACFRTAWAATAGNGPISLLIKGGNSLGAHSGEKIFLHAQSDAGTFVVDGARTRWVIDLGPDEYDLPGYFDHGVTARPGRRWSYYRASTAGHNTLVLNGHNQIPNAAAPILDHCTAPDASWAIFDLSPAYGRSGRSLRRGAALVGKRIVIRDEANGGTDATAVWVLHTAADPVSLMPTVARFRSGDDHFIARIIEPDNARFHLIVPPPPQTFATDADQLLHDDRAGNGAVVEFARRDGAGNRRGTGSLIRRLEIWWPHGARNLTVLLLPDATEDGAAIRAFPLDCWPTKGPIAAAGDRRCDLRAA